MTLKLKRSFHLKREDGTFDAVCKEHAKIFVNQSMLDQARQGLIDAITERNKLLRETLLNDHGYVIHTDDKIMFLEQTGEIRIMQDQTEDINYGDSNKS